MSLLVSPFVLEMRRRVHVSDSRSRSPPPSRIPVWRGPPPRSASMTEAEVMASDLANPPSPDDSPPRHFSPSWCETPPSPPTPSSAAMDPVSVPVPGAASATCTCPICWLGSASASRGPVLPSAPARSALLLQSPSRAHFCPPLSSSSPPSFSGALPGVTARHPRPLLVSSLFPPSSYLHSHPPL